MVEIRRLTAAGALLAIAAVLTSSTVWGDPAKDKELKKWRSGAGEVIRPDDGGPIKALDNDTAVDEDIVIEKNRFADVPVITYQTRTGEWHFALQVQPKLPDEPARPTDYLVLVDTSASK